MRLFVSGNEMFSSVRGSGISNTLLARSIIPDSQVYAEFYGRKSFSSCKPGFFSSLFAELQAKLYNIQEVFTKECQKLTKELQLRYEAYLSHYRPARETLIQTVFCLL